MDWTVRTQNGLRRDEVAHIATGALLKPHADRVVQR